MPWIGPDWSKNQEIFSKILFCTFLIQSRIMRHPISQQHYCAEGEYSDTHCIQGVGTGCYRTTHVVTKTTRYGLPVDLLESRTDQPWRKHHHDHVWSTFIHTSTSLPCALIKYVLSNTSKLYTWCKLTSLPSWLKLIGPCVCLLIQYTWLW